MRVHPDIAALRGDPVAQRRARAAMEAALDGWERDTAVADIKRDFRAFASGTALADLPALASLLTDHSRARDFAAHLVSQFCHALRQERLGEVPFRHRSSEGYARLQIMQTRGAMLSLCVFEPLESATTAQTAQFLDCEMHEIVIAGRAHAMFYRLDDAEGIAARKEVWEPGQRTTLHPLRDMRQIVRVEHSLLVIQLTRTPERPAPSREYRIADGALLQTVSGDKRASALVMALGVLGALGQARTLDAIVAFARNRAGDTEARWEAVRQVLAMDAGAGMALLGSLVHDGDDPLAQPATDLAAQLIAAHPQLRALEAG